jgi:two-component system sensor histidine kinase KdpD
MPWLAEVRRLGVVRYVAAASGVAACALVCWVAFGPAHQLADVAMVMLLGVTILSMLLGRGPSLFAAVLSALSFDYFFIPPSFSFEIDDLQHTVTFAVMVFVAFVVSHLTTRVRDQALEARDRERRTANLYAVSRDVGMALSRDALLESAAGHLARSFGVPLLLLTPGRDGNLEARGGDPVAKRIWESEPDVAEAAWRSRSPAGSGTATHGNAKGLYVPLRGSRGCPGVVALVATIRQPAERDLLEAFAGLIGSALERTELADEAREARLHVEAEQLRNALLSSISHDFRTPLAVVIGSASALLEPDGPRDEVARRRLLETAQSEALRLNRQLVNVLQMTRLEAGALPLRSEPQSVEEVVGAALSRLEDRLSGRDVAIEMPADLPLVPFDSVLIEQVLVNLLENAMKYTPAGAPIRVAAVEAPGSIEIEVADRGPGIAPGDAARIFEKYERVHEREGGGFGLGLAICRGIVASHGGRIWVDSRTGGGASFRFTLPFSDGGSPEDVDAAGRDSSAIG